MYINLIDKRGKKVWSSQQGGFHSISSSLSLHVCVGGSAGGDPQQLDESVGCMAGVIGFQRISGRDPPCI